MRKIFMALTMISLAISAMAANKSQLNNEIQSLSDQFTAMQQSSNRVPADTLARAQGIILLNQTKGGLIFGYHTGNGVALVKDNGQWSAPAFVTSTGASIGLQGGGEHDFDVILLMNTNSAVNFTRENINFGVNASATGGNDNGNAQANTMTNSVAVYTQQSGLFGGAAFKGGSVTADEKADSEYYGKSVSMDQILFGHQVQPTGPEQSLISKISQYSK